jgi:hypothetical protein
MNSLAKLSKLQIKFVEFLSNKLYKLNLEDIMTSCLKENKNNLEDD